MPVSGARGPLAVLAALARGGAATTEALYDRMGYPELMRLGLIPYPAFRAALDQLEEEDLVASEPTDDGSTSWRSTPRGDAVAARDG